MANAKAEPMPPSSLYGRRSLTEEHRAQPGIPLGLNLGGCHVRVVAASALSCDANRG